MRVNRMKLHMKTATSTTTGAETLPDAELARLMAGGDIAAFELVMRRHNRMLFRTARAILRDDAEAEDALQEAYLQAYHAIGGFRGEAKLSTWLARIVANQALMRLRKRARRGDVLPLHSSAEPDGTDTDMPRTPEQETQRAQIRKLLEAQIDSLPEAYRAVFMLRAVEELSVEETAAVLQIPEATVRTRLFRARSLLREALAARIDVAYEDAFAFAGERCDRIVASVLERVRKKGGR
jgi:RNA polymerase sigma-70 factor (ECF subfamily)